MSLSVPSGLGGVQRIASSSRLSRSEPTLIEVPSRRSFLFLGLGAAFAAAFGVASLAEESHVITVNVFPRGWKVQAGDLLSMGEEFMRVSHTDGMLVTVTRVWPVKDVSPALGSPTAPLVLRCA